MNITELINQLQVIKSVEGQDSLDVFMVDIDHALPLATVQVGLQTNDPNDPPDEASTPSKGLFLINSADWS